MAKKITQNVNKDAGLLDLPRVRVPRSKWKTEHSNYLTCNIGDIVPVYVDEVLPKEKRRVTMGMLSHMTTPIAPIFNAQYTEFRAFFVPHRLSADLMNGFSTRKSPWVKVFGEDNKNTGADIIVPLSNQKLPTLPLGTDNAIVIDFLSNIQPFGALSDSLDYSIDETALFGHLNGLSMAAYELIYQHCYRNQNRESATNSNLYKWLFNIYNRTAVNGISYDDKFHVANREKDYFTGAQPFTQKGDSVKIPVGDEAPVVGKGEQLSFEVGASTTKYKMSANTTLGLDGPRGDGAALFPSGEVKAIDGLVADLTQATGIDIEQLRILIKTQEMLEKDMMYGSDYMSSLNAHFGTAPMSLVLDKPLELKKVTITSHMQPVFQTSQTSGETTILGQIGANATTQSGEFEIVPMTEFKEYGYLIICACHKAQNSYDAAHYKPKHIFKSARFDFYTPELNDLGFQPVQRKEFAHANYDEDFDEAVGFNESFAEYRYKFNKVHGMFEPSRNNALDYWTLAMSNYDDIESMYKQATTELDRAISVTTANAPQFFDAYGFIEINDKPMSLHSIPGFDGVI